MQISILGCGWLGFPLALKLKELEFQVLGASRNSSKLQALEANGISAFQIDLQPEIVGTNLESFFQSNLLILTIPPGRSRPDVSQFYPKAVQNILKHFKGQKLIYTSSTGVYGQIAGIVDELTPPDPNTPSSRAVYEAERLIQKQMELKSTILRLAGLAGPKRHPGKWLAGRQNLPNGDAPVNLVHQADVMTAIIQVIQQNAWKRLFNVCAEDHPTKSSYYTWAADTLQLPAPSFNPGGEQNKLVDSTVIRRTLGMHFQYDNPYDFFE